jgi:hypothetical protein
MRQQLCIVRYYVAIRASQAGGNKVKWKDIKKLGKDQTEYCCKFMFKSLGHAGAQLVEALRSKPEGRGFHSRWSQWNVSLT